MKNPEVVLPSAPQNPFVHTKWFIILLGALTAFDPLTIDMYLPAFGQIQKEFATSIGNVELSVSTFFFGMAFGQLLYGPLADRFGRKKPLIGGMLLYFVATLGCAWSPNIEVFIGFRLLQALGGCAGMVITRAIVRDVFGVKEVAIFLSHMALVMGIAPIIAPTVGSFINDLFGWRAIFEILAAGNILCLIAIFTLLPETSQKRLSEIRISTTIKSYFDLIKQKSFIGFLIPDAFVRAGMFAYIAGSPFVFIEILHIPASKYGLIFGINGLGLMLAAQINRRLLRIRTPQTILLWSVRAAALFSMIVFLSAFLGADRVIILSSIFLFLATLNFISPNSLAGALASQGHRAGTASALYGCLQWSMASVASFFVSYFHNGTAMPMTAVILFCGLFSLTAFQILIKQKTRA